MNVAFYVNGNGRARHIMECVAQGCRRHGQRVDIRHVHEYRRPEFDVAVFYGLWSPLKQLQADYIAAGRKAVLIDLGYWGRIEGGKLEGYHRIAVNGLHCGRYFQSVKRGPERFDRFNIRRREFKRDGDFILLCGMSGKAAWVYGLEPEEWERRTVAELRKHTAREIRYRPKQSWKDARPIPGTTWAPDTDLIGPEQLRDCHAVVTHHGNSALDALIHGVPVFVDDGLCKSLSGFLECIETPVYPLESERDQLLYDAAWTQWNANEIRRGDAWEYLRGEGLIS